MSEEEATPPTKNRARRRRSTPRPLLRFSPEESSLVALSDGETSSLDENSETIPSPRQPKGIAPIARAQTYDTGELSNKLKVPTPGKHQRRHSTESGVVEVVGTMRSRRAAKLQEIGKLMSIVNLPEVISMTVREPAEVCLTNRSILERIIANLEVCDIPNICRVCKAWNNAMEHREVWLRLFEAYEKRVKSPGEEETLNIWSSERPEEDKKVTLDKDGNIKWTTLNALVEHLTPASGIPDKTDEQVLLNTYTSFTTTQQLIRKLFERYNVPPPTDVEDMEKWEKEVKRPIQVRTAYILKSLIALRWKEFDVTLKRLVKVIIRLLDKNLSGVIKMQIMREDNKYRAHSESAGAASPQALAVKKSAVFFTGLQRRSLEFISSLEIAKQLTLIDFRIFSQIQPQELHNQAWCKKNKEKTSPNVLKLIDRFNTLTRTIATSILNEEKLKQRAKIMTKWIKVADCLRKLNNFHTLMAVLSGFAENSIFRLKATKAEIAPKYLRILEELEELMSSAGSNANYRKAFAAAKPPGIPYIGIYLRDIIYIETGTPAEQEASEQKGIIQFRQKKKVFAIINFLQTYQATAYDFQEYDDLIEYLLTLPALSEEELYELSNKREPRNNNNKRNSAV